MLILFAILVITANIVTSVVIAIIMMAVGTKAPEIFVWPRRDKGTAETRVDAPLLSTA